MLVANGIDVDVLVGDLAYAAGQTVENYPRTPAPARYRRPSPGT